MTLTQPFPAPDESFLIQFLTFRLLRTSDMTTTSDSEAPLSGHRFEQLDQSIWEIQKPISDLVFQEDIPPFESRQVYTCVCLQDPNRKYPGVREAIAKVKYQ
jgi:hypothetical protein